MNVFLRSINVSVNVSRDNYGKTIYLLEQNTQKCLTIINFRRHKMIHDKLSRTSLLFTRYSFQNTNALCAKKPSNIILNVTRKVSYKSVAEKNNESTIIINKHTIPGQFRLSNQGKPGNFPFWCTLLALPHMFPLEHIHVPPACSRLSNVPIIFSGPYETCSPGCISCDFVRCMLLDCAPCFARCAFVRALFHAS